ncbi:hypothetical protein LJR153_007283 [Paenibacillus sp. LjRoot153]|uniref:hypothetical protein n=1 Tax=Paenibacillus sp. LjRoot153 TaxID=3342270 RepID=UPI003ECD0EAE
MYPITRIDDDDALAASAKAIRKTLSATFLLTKLVFPSEELMSDWSDTRRDNFLNKLENLVEKAEEALKETDKINASKKWIDVFGDRFPEHETTEAA